MKDMKDKELMLSLCLLGLLLDSTGGGGGSSIVKVPGDVPPVRVCFSNVLVQPRVYFLPIFVHLVWARVCFLAILVKEISNFGNSCKETQIFFKFWSLESKNLASFV